MKNSEGLSGIKNQHYGNTFLLVNPPVVSSSPGERLSKPYLDLMIGGTPKSSYFSIPIEHLGLLSIKSYSRKKRLDIDIINGIVEKHHSPQETMDRIRKTVSEKGPPLLIGFSQILAFEQSAWMAKECKRTWPEVKTLFGHDFATLNWRRILRDYESVDYVAVGEGERIFADLAIAILNCKPIDDIPGLAYRENGGNPAMRANPLPMDLDELPWPSREELPAVKSFGFSAGLIASRGCPYQCSYCTTGQVTRIVGKGGYRYRSAEDVAEEMYYLWKFQECDFINICDDLFLTPSNQSKSRAYALAMALEKRGYRGHFMLDARVDSIDVNLFRRLYESGLRRVFVGVESGSEELLQQFDKKYILRGKTVEEKLRSITELGIDVIPGIISFHPHVQPSELRKTLSIMESTNFQAPHMLTSPVIVFPGTSLHQRYLEENLLDEEWPMGLWHFSDRRAKQAHFELKRLVGLSGSITFETFAENARLILDDWESDLKSERGVRSTQVINAASDRSH